jgi:hypothetical protein
MKKDEESQTSPLLEERKFLHRLSTPLSTLGLLIESMNECRELDPVTLDQIKSTLSQVYELLKDRRQTLIDRG